MLAVVSGSAEVADEGRVVVVVDVDNVEGNLSEVMLDGKLVEAVEVEDVEISACVEGCVVSTASVVSICWVVSGAIVDSGELVVEVLGVGLLTGASVSTCRSIR